MEAKQSFFKVKNLYISIDGCSLPEQYKIRKNEIDDFEVYDDDIWVCSNPKGGTTWAQEMIWMIVNDLDFEKGRESLDARSPYLEVSAISNIGGHPELDVPLYFQDSINFTKNIQRPRIIKTHLPFNLLPNQIKSGWKRPKIVYITRESKDTCVSRYNHMKLMGGFQGTFDDVCELFLSGKSLYGPYWTHVFSYWKFRNSPNFLFLKYEDMKKDLKKIIREVAEILQRPLSDEKIQILSEHLSFDSMKKNPAVNREDVVDLFQKYTSANYDGKFMRVGKVGDYKNFMTEDYIKKFDEWIRVNTEGTDYEV